MVSNVRFLIFTLLYACSSPSKDEQTTIEKACQGMSVETVKQVDDISDECKDAITALLPSPQDSLGSRIFDLGYDDTSAKHRLILSGTTAAGKALSADELQDIELYAVVSGIKTKLPSSAYTVTKALDLSQNLLSVSLVGDYSGSMSDKDIALVSELFTDFTTYLTPISDFEVIYFSTNVLQQQTLTSDRDLLASALQMNQVIPRASTALYDGMGQGIVDLSSSNRLGHILMVGTDGMENSSQQYTKDALKQLMASDKKLLVVMMGTFLSDIAEMQELTAGKGVFVYAQTVKAAKEAALAFSQSLRESVVVEISELYQSIDTWEASYNDASVQIGD